MFGKKKAPRAAARIVLFNAFGTELLACPVGEYALPESVVLALSVEYFNDPEPCAIHRGAVHKRAMMELLERCPVGTSLSLSSLEAPIRSYFPEEAAVLRIEEAVE